ncbi:hypothetical protein QZN85_19980, partial [Burkholderia vietnamiensis]|nr:hypothetical protein [Burkholderia vietnamiensis]
PGFMWRFSLVPCSGGWSWKPDSLGFHWRTAAFNLQLRLGHCRLLGHESIDDTRRYIDVDREVLSRILEEAI